jgi:hypothetical protein
MRRWVPVTRVRRCAEEAKGGLELAWSIDVALAFQRLCETSPSSSRLDAEVTGHTTPAVADIGRGSLRVRFLGRKKGEDAASAHAPAFPTGGLLLGVRRKPTRLSSFDDDESFSSAKTQGTARRRVHDPFRFLPAIAAAPGDRGPDRYDASRDGLAELVVMARPLVVDEMTRGEETTNRFSERFSARSAPKRADDMVTSLDDDALRAFLPVGAGAEVVLVRRVTGFHLGLNANRWLKIRMREIADGVTEVLAREDAEFDRSKTVESAAVAKKEAVGNVESGDPFERFLRETGLVLDVSSAVRSVPIGASFEFEHWGAGGNTGVSGQVTKLTSPGEEKERGVGQ